MNLKNRKGRYTGILRVVLVCLLLAGCAPAEAGKQPEINSGTLQVHFLDVGQADCTIIQNGRDAMIIDAGNNEDADFILSYLDELGIESLVYAVGTHSHEDHIGSLDSVLDAFAVGTVILPEEDSKTKTYQDVLRAVHDRGAELLRPSAGEEYDLGDASFILLAPDGEEHSDPNEYSVGLLLTYGKTKFLFTGDAPQESEERMAALGINLEADVLQAGHHGSSTSNSEVFLQQADPVYTVISCGKDNKYGHPHAEVMARLEEMDVQIYRTDKQGSITAESDGTDISWSVETSIVPGEKEKDIQTGTDYIINTGSGKFHLAGCSSAADIKSGNRKEEKTTREQLVEQGYQPCARCKP